jgi:hypothetical protein
MPNSARAAPVVPGPLSPSPLLEPPGAAAAAWVDTSPSPTTCPIPCRLRSGLVAVKVGVGPPVAVAIGTFSRPLYYPQRYEYPANLHDRLDPAAAPALTYDHPHVQQHRQLP